MLIEKTDETIDFARGRGFMESDAVSNAIRKMNDISL